MESLYVNRLAPEIADRYRNKLQLYCNNLDPYTLEVSLLSTDIKDLPNINEDQIFSYLRLSKCPYSGTPMMLDDSVDYTDEAKVGVVKSLKIKKLEDITIVLGEVG